MAEPGLESRLSLCTKLHARKASPEEAPADFRTELLSELGCQKHDGCGEGSRGGGRWLWSQNFRVKACDDGHLELRVCVYLLVPP